MPALSVIVPVYNGERYLRECLDSVINQSYKDFELILINDGSKDSSGAICDEYKDKYDNVVVIHKENGGVTAARRDGLKNASGTFVTFVDCDDWIDSDMYEKMLGKAEEYNAEAVICSIVYETENGQVKHRNTVESGLYNKEKLMKDFYPKMLFDFRVCLPGVNPSLCNKVFKKELLDNVIFGVNNTISYGEDALCTYPTLMDADSVFVMDTPFYHYRKNDDSVTHRYDSTLLDKFLVLAEEMEAFFTIRGFDCTEQLDGYVARYSLECIRSELLFGSAALPKRLKAVRGYVDKERVYNAFVNALGKISEKKTVVKMKLVIKRRMFLLFLLLYAKNIKYMYKVNQNK